MPKAVGFASDNRGGVLVKGSDGITRTWKESRALREGLVHRDDSGKVCLGSKKLETN